METTLQPRRAQLRRDTKETQISIELNIDGGGIYSLETGNGMFEHLLAQLSRHGLIDLTVSAKGDTNISWHHLVEDTGILLGRTLKLAIGDGRGIVRMGHAYAPLDETLALVVVDFSGRGYSVIEAPMDDSDLGQLPADLIRHFLESFAREGAFNLHVRLIAGVNNHHKAEAIFKAMARAMRAALSYDPRRLDDIPSTKGVLG